MPHLLNRKTYTRAAALSVVLGTALLLSSCMEISNPLSSETKVAEKQVGEAREAVKKAHKEEEKEFKKEKQEEKAEDKSFAKMKRQLEADQARAPATSSLARSAKKKGYTPSVAAALGVPSGAWRTASQATPPR